MKRVMALLLALGTLLLCGCGEPTVDADAYRMLSDAVSVVNKERRFCTDFLMETTFRDPSTGRNSVLYFLDGRASCDRDKKTAFQDYKATVLGASYHAYEYLSERGRVHEENGQVMTYEQNIDDALKAFPYSLVSLPPIESLRSLVSPDTPDGSYTLTWSEGQKELIEDVWQVDLYNMARIVVPDESKEKFGEVTCILAVKDGALASVTWTLSATIYETPGYTPGYTPKEEDSRLDLSIRAKLTFVSFGNDVKIPVYEENA